MKHYLLLAACGLVACTPSSETTEPADSSSAPVAVTSAPAVDVAEEIAEAAAAVGASPVLASPEGDWQLFFEVDDRKFFLEEVGKNGAVVRVRTKNVDPSRDAVFVAFMEVDCVASTATDGSFMVEYGSSGEFRSFIKEESTSRSPIEGDYLESLHRMLCGANSADV